MTKYVIEDFERMILKGLRNFPGLSGWALNPITSVPSEAEGAGTDTENTQKKGRGSVTKEVQIRVKRNAWGYQKVEEARMDSSLEHSEGMGFFRQPDFRILASRTVREFLLFSVTKFVVIFSGSHRTF